MSIRHILMFVFFFSFLVTSSQADDTAKLLRISNYYLETRVINDNVIWCRLGEGVAPKKVAFPTPMVHEELQKHLNEIPVTSQVGDKFEAKKITVESNRERGSFVFKEKINLFEGEGSNLGTHLLFELSPWVPEGTFGGLSVNDEGQYTDLYGLGAVGGDEFNLLGKQISASGVFGQAQNQMPILYALGQDFKNVALFIDETRPLSWDFKGRPFTISVAGPLMSELKEISFFVLSGSNLADLRKEYLQITGHALVPPRSLFGLWLDDYNYESWQDLEKTIDFLTEANLSVSGFILGNNWSGGDKIASNGLSTVGSLLWDEKKFPQAKQEAEKLKNQGVGLILEESPYFSADRPEMRIMQTRRQLVAQRQASGDPLLLNLATGAAHLIDFTNFKGADYWHDLKRLPLLNSVLGWSWPVAGDLPVFSSQAYYHGSPLEELAGLHNHYPMSSHYSLHWLASLYRGALRQGGDAKRPFALTAPLNSGAWRYGALFSSGQKEDSFIKPRFSLIAQQQAVLSGADFYSWSTEHNSGTLRFAQEALWSVPLRPLGWQKTEPEIKPYFLRTGHVASNRSLLTLRTILEPYYYSLAHQVNVDAEPMLAPLVYYFQDDLMARPRWQEAMLGSFILVGSLNDELSEENSVYLPKGQWFNWHSGLEIVQEQGGLVTFSSKDGDAFIRPILVKAGAIIPMKPEKYWFSSPDGKIVEEKPDLWIRIYPSEHKSEFKLIEDDGWSVAYLKGEKRITDIKSEKIKDGLMVTIKAAQGDFKAALPKRQLMIELVGRDATGDAILNGQPYSRTSNLAELNIMNSGWTMTKTGRLYFKTPPMDVKQELIFVFK